MSFLFHWDNSCNWCRRWAVQVARTLSAPHFLSLKIKYLFLLPLLSRFIKHSEKCFYYINKLNNHLLQSRGWQRGRTFFRWELNPRAKQQDKQLCGTYSITVHIAFMTYLSLIWFFAWVSYGDFAGWSNCGMAFMENRNVELHNYHVCPKWANQSPGVRSTLGKSPVNFLFDDVSFSHDITSRLMTPLLVDPKILSF